MSSHSRRWRDSQSFCKKLNFDKVTVMDSPQLMDAGVFEQLLDPKKRYGEDDKEGQWGEESFSSPSQLMSPNSALFSTCTPSRRKGPLLHPASPERSDGSSAPIPACPETPPHKTPSKLQRLDTPHKPKSLQSPKRTSSSMRGYIFNDVKSATMSFKESITGTHPMPLVNFNPFSPDSLLIQSATQQGSNRKRVHWNVSSGGEDLETGDAKEHEEIMPASKSITMMQSNMMASRYDSEFLELEEIGCGQFGTVFKCVKRLDGCIYAIKHSKKPLTGAVEKQKALQEVYAHAVLHQHPHVVHYYSAWVEDGHMFIQNEYCNGGTLSDVITDNAKRLRHLTELELKDLLLQVVRGLKHIHSMSLVHMDIKPSNIFICCKSIINCDEDNLNSKAVYKIGDLGHVTRANNSLVEEGDCRYLANEVFQQDYTDLAKADVFALALTVISASGAQPLANNGDAWHEIRLGKLPDIPQVLLLEFVSLLKLMIDPDLARRPSTSDLIYHPVLLTATRMNAKQLRVELNAVKLKNALLRKELQNVQLAKSTAEKTNRPWTRSNRSCRLIGKSMGRSFSLNIL
nr:wee1-like protein kinase 1-B isoform X3 [Nerophis lumbriciformis]